MTTRTRLDAELATRGYTRRHAREIVTAVLGNNSGTVVATADTRWYWIRLHGDPNQVVRAWNAGFVPPVNNLPVDIEIVKGTGITDYQIIGVSINKGVAADVYSGAIGMHALQHQRRDFNTGGFDPLDIYGRAIVQLRARAQATPDMTLYVEPGWYPVAGIAAYFAGGNSAAFVPPGFGFRCDLLYLDNAGALQIVTGTTIPFGTPVRPAQPTATDLPLAYVYLTATTTSITEYIIEDARVIFGGGAGGTAGADIDAAPADTPLDADEFGFYDVVAALLKKITWANLKTTLKTFLHSFFPYEVQVQPPIARNFLMRDGTWRDPFLVGDGTLTVGAPAMVTDDTKYNAWPNVCRMQNGNLIAVYTKGDTHNADNTGHIVGKISSDDGATWGAEFTIYTDAAYWSTAMGVSSLASGRVIISFLRDNAGAAIGVDENYIIYSDDFGATWGSKVNVNSSFTSFSYASGPVVQLNDGTLRITVEGKDIGDPFSSMHILTSSDNGATWGGEVTIATGTRNYYEGCLLPLDNADLIVLLRTTGGAGNIYLSRSTNDGATWSAPAVTFAGYGQPHVIQSWTGSLICITRDNATAGVIAYTSTDRGATWSALISLDATMTEMEYGCPVDMLDHRVLVVYGYQPTAATTNSDIKKVIVTEGLTSFTAGLAPIGHIHNTVDGTTKLLQANSHETPDTDAAAGSLHHTIGAGATQAAAGNHTHAGSGGVAPLTAELIAWDDVRVGGESTKPGATAPALTAFGPSGNLKVLFFENGHNDEVHFEIQMPHTWKTGSKIYPHVHWTPVSATAGNVVWELEYIWKDIGGTFGAPSTMASDATAAGGTAWVHKMTYLKDGGGNNYIDGSGISGISSMLECRLHRNAGVGSDTLVADVAFLEFDVHYQIDSFGSDFEASKTAGTRYDLVWADGDLVMCEV